jgi:hypothetical protein
VLELGEMESRCMLACNQHLHCCVYMAGLGTVVAGSHSLIHHSPTLSFVTLAAALPAYKAALNCVTESLGGGRDVVDAHLAVAALLAC